MSVGMFTHSIFGPAKRYIYNNKYVLQVEHDKAKAQNWVKKFQEFKYSYLSAKEPQFILFPEEILHKKHSQANEKSQEEPEKITILYEHYVVTLREELVHREQHKDEFEVSELWYFLCCLVSGGLELTQIHNLTNIYEQPIITIQNILLNGYGMIKIVGDYSSPWPVEKNPCFQTPTKEKQLLAKKNLLSATFSIGRIMASLIMLKQLQFFQKEGMFDDLGFRSELCKHKERLGVLYNLVLGMLQGLPEQRILLHEISALIFPYEMCLLNLQNFRLDKTLCRQSMMNILIKPS